jgi:sulfoxide reductase catalytic subunit YedY
VAARDALLNLLFISLLFRSGFEILSAHHGTIHVEYAKNAQTILAYEMNSKPLPVAHGAPLRLRLETQLGFTMVKYIRAIEFVENYSHIGLGQGGWREDHQYYSPEAGI